MSVSGIQGQLLEVTVVGCSKLKDTEWISSQDPYVILENCSTKFLTRTCTNGGKKPTFQEKYLTYVDFIGSGKVQLKKILSQHFDDNSWTLQTKTGR